MASRYGLVDRRPSKVKSTVTGASRAGSL